MRYSVFANNESTPLEISSIGFGDDDESTSWGPGQRNLYIIHYVLEGEGYYNGNIVKEGQGFLIYPDQLTHYYGNPENPWKFLWVISHDNSIADIFDRYDTDTETNIFDYSDTEVLSKLSKKLIKNKRVSANSLELLEMFLHIVNSHFSYKTFVKSKPNSKKYIDFCVTYIENNIHKKITVHELTALLGVTQQYLYNIFRKEFNMSIKQYITNHKFAHARKLLLETDMTVTQIANSVGYNDILVFTKAFKLNENISPTNYRLKFKK